MDRFGERLFLLGEKNSCGDGESVSSVCSFLSQNIDCLLGSRPCSWCWGAARRGGDALEFMTKFVLPDAAPTRSALTSKCIVSCFITYYVFSSSKSDMIAFAMPQTGAIGRL